MATYQKPKTEQFDITLTEDVNAPDDERTVFHCKPLTVAQGDTVTNMTQAGQIASAFRFACRASIIGWENLSGLEYSPDAVNKLKTQWILELGAVIIEKSILTDSEKN